MVIVGVLSISSLDAHLVAFIVFCFLAGGGSMVSASSSSLVALGLFLVAAGFFVDVEGLLGAFFLAEALVVFVVDLTRFQ